MKMQKMAIALTLVNLVILAIVLAKISPAKAQADVQHAAQVLRGRGLEIVDNNGKLRASITLQPAVEVNGKKYKETILFRLISPQGKPMVKIGGAEDGSGLTLIDDADEGILINSHRNGTTIRMTNQGRERIIQP